MLETTIAIQKVEYPDDTSSHVNFDQPVQIRWPKVDGEAFHLCVGTEPGDWDITSANMGNRRQQLFDLSDLPAEVETVYVQLITLADDSTVGKIIELKR